MSDRQRVDEQGADEQAVDEQGVDELQVRPISHDAIERAIEKAIRYRNLNDPGPSQSICEDILAAEPGHQQALMILVLALTDDFKDDGVKSQVRRARKLASQIEEEYRRLYYNGVVSEREARALLGRGAVLRSHCYEGFREAMHWYDRAHAVRPPDNDDPILRWNYCVRTIQGHRLTPEVDERGELPLE